MKTSTGKEPKKFVKGSRIPSTGNPKGHLAPEDVGRLISAATNPRDKAFVALLARSGVRITEAIQIKVSDIDFEKGRLTIPHLKEKVNLKCPHCGEGLGKKHIFCPGCGKKVEEAVRQKIEQRHERTIPIDRDTLNLIEKYLEWRKIFKYSGPLVFPFTRHRGWQIVEKLGRRIGIKGLHPHSFRHFLATTWVGKGLDVKKLQILLGHANIGTTMEYVDSSFDQLNFEYQKLWRSIESGEGESYG